MKSLLALTFRVQAVSVGSSGLRGSGSGFRVLGFRAQSFWLRDYGIGFRFYSWASGCVPTMPTQSRFTVQDS